jgi:hypothetical protein
MAQPDDLAARLTALETEVHDLSHEVRVTRRDAVAARVLAGGAGRDVSEIRGEIRDFRQATTGSLNALREDRLDIRRQLTEGFAEMRGKFDAAAAATSRLWSC